MIVSGPDRIAAESSAAIDMMQDHVDLWCGEVRIVLPYSTATAARWALIRAVCPQSDAIFFRYAHAGT